MRAISLLISVLTVALSSQTTHGDDMPKRTAELQVLERFVGSWDFDVTSTPANGKAVTGKTSETRTWTLGGTFVRFENAKSEKPEEP
ncbi:MAG: hypothetical protein ACKOFW_23675, partial [Planctomycetaceae bacterium]